MAMPSQMPGTPKTEGDAAAGVDAALDVALQASHVDVAGDQVGEAVAMPMKGVRICSRGQAGGVQQGAVGRPLDAPSWPCRCA